MTNKFTFLLFTVLGILNIGNAQVFDVDTLQYKGDPGNYINLVIMGDGYTSAELGKFTTDATGLSNYLFSQSPWSHYANYFNIFIIKVISNESGCKHPETAPDCDGSVPVSNPDTYLGCTFDAYGIHRLVVADSMTKVMHVLSANFPNYDQVFIIANTPYYGGSGGSYATSTTDAAAPEITAHELGHSFAGLADEYYAGDGYAGEYANMTKQTNPALVKWKNWMGINGTGINQHCCGGNSSQWYKPSTNCKMQLLGPPYCSVCSETIIEKIHSLVNPIVSYEPVNLVVTSTNQVLKFELTEIMKPTSNSLLTDWKLDGKSIAKNVDSVKINQNIISNGAHSLTVSVTDTNYLLKVDNHTTKHISSVSWKFTNTSSGTLITTRDNKISYSLYPNPTAALLHISFEAEKSTDMAIDIMSLHGKIVQHVTKESVVKGIYSKTVDIQDLANGIYLIVFNTGGVIHSEIFIKE